MRFAIPFEQHNTTVSTTTLNNLSTIQRNNVEHLNALDTELYAFAKKLLFQRYVHVINNIILLNIIILSIYLYRFEKIKAKDSDFEVRFSNLGNLGIRNGVTEFNWDSNIEDASTDQH